MKMLISGAGYLDRLQPNCQKLHLQQGKKTTPSKARFSVQFFQGQAAQTKRQTKPGLPFFAPVLFLQYPFSVIMIIFAALRFTPF